MKPNQYFSTYLSRLCLMLICLSVFSMAGANEEAVSTELPKEKQTSLELYVTSAQAYEKWRTAPDEIKVFDVRTLEEYIFIGHAPMAWNIPLLSQTHEWDAEKGRFAMLPNPDFLAQVKEVAEPTDTIMVMCRSGGRSAMAINLLAEAGFTNVYNITDGFEGDKVEDPGSVYEGKRLRNGWKNSAVPWTYKVNTEQMKLANRQQAVATAQ